MMYNVKKINAISPVYHGILPNGEYNVNADEDQGRALSRMHSSAITDFRNTISGYSTLRARSEQCTPSNESSKYALYPVLKE